MVSKTDSSGVWKWVAGILASGAIITGIALGQQVLMNGNRITKVETQIESISENVKEIRTDVKALLSRE